MTFLWSDELRNVLFNKKISKKYSYLMNIISSQVLGCLRLDTQSRLVTLFLYISMV